MPPREPSPGPDGLTRAEAKALSRCAPLSPEEFKALGRVADEGLLSLPAVMDDRSGARRP